MQGEVNHNYVKYISITLTTVVGLWGAIEFITERLDKYIEKRVEESVKIAFTQKEKEYINQIEKRVGHYIDPIDEFTKSIDRRDSIKIVYERIIPYIKEKSDMLSVGLNINKKTKEMFYTDSSGVEYKVYKEGNKLYYFNGKQIIYING